VLFLFVVRRSDLSEIYIRHERQHGLVEGMGGLGSTRKDRMIVRGSRRSGTRHGGPAAAGGAGGADTISVEDTKGLEATTRRDRKTLMVGACHRTGKYEIPQGGKDEMPAWVEEGALSTWIGVFKWF
jgi:hypothetical protein